MIYLNNAATSAQKPVSVLNRMRDFFTENSLSSPGRTVNSRLTEAAVVSECREEICSLFGIRLPERIAFTANATHALNLAIQGVLKPGYHVITTAWEHNSVFRPLEKLRSQDVSYSVITPDSNGLISAESIERELRIETALIIINHSSNVTGVLQPIKEIGEYASSRNIPLLVDAAQSAGLIDIDVVRDHISLLAFTGHKSLYGPQGIGGLYFARDIDPEPVLVGGTGTFSESLVQPDVLPDKYEAGTPNLPAIAGLAEGIRFVMETGMNNILGNELKLREKLIDGLKKIQGIRLIGYYPDTPSTGIVSFLLDPLDSNELGDMLEKSFDIVTRSGLHCAPLAHRHLQTIRTGTVRVSFGFYNTEEDVDILINALRSISNTINNNG